MLSAYLVPFERAFCFQITEQSSKLNRALKTHDSFVASNGWTVTKALVPEIQLDPKVIFLRGDDGDRNLRVSRTWDLSNNNARDKYLSQINSALQEFVNFASNKGRVFERDIYGYYTREALKHIAGCKYIMSDGSLGTVKLSYECTTQPKLNTVSSKTIIAA